MGARFDDIKPLTDEEEADIQKQIASDPDDFPDTAEPKSFADVFPALAESIRRSRGRPRSEAPKEAVTLRVNPSTLEKFKATGNDWRTRMSEALDRVEI